MSTCSKRLPVFFRETDFKTGFLKYLCNRILKTRLHGYYPFKNFSCIKNYLKIYNKKQKIKNILVINKKVKTRVHGLLITLNTGIYATRVPIRILPEPAVRAYTGTL